MCHEMSTLQSAGTDSAVNLWLASTNLDELTTERSVSYLICLYNFYMTAYIFYSSMLAFLAVKQIRLPVGLIHYLIHTVIMKTAFMVRAAIFLIFDHRRLLLSNF